MRELSIKLILLVDDNRDDLLLIGRAFERAGLRDHVRSLPTGMEAIAYLKGRLPLYRPGYLSRARSGAA